MSHPMIFWLMIGSSVACFALIVLALALDGHRYVAFLRRLEQEPTP